MQRGNRERESLRNITQADASTLIDGCRRRSHATSRLRRCLRSRPPLTKERMNDDDHQEEHLRQPTNVDHGRQHDKWMTDLINASAGVACIIYGALQTTHTDILSTRNAAVAAAAARKQHVHINITPGPHQQQCRSNWVLVGRPAARSICPCWRETTVGDVRLMSTATAHGVRRATGTQILRPLLRRVRAMQSLRNDEAARRPTHNNSFVECSLSSVHKYVHLL